jgi:dihydrodipicolinate synthase/N-acetylneuraminate lyase
MAAVISLPGRREPLMVSAAAWPDTHPAPVLRRAYAAAHVVADGAGGIDWDSTMAFRDHLWSHGFAIAEAMDTAQRGMGLSWQQAKELISRTAERAASRGAIVAAGAGTDQLADGERHGLQAIVRAYEEQLDFVQQTGAQVVIMASRALAATASSRQDYLDVYGYLLKQVDRPVILHWLGQAFDPALRGYWGSSDFSPAADLVVELIERSEGRVDGVKLSVLDAGREIALRRRFPPGVRMYTGDDFNYAELIRGGPAGHSDALLGAFAAVTAPAAEALQALDAGDLARYDAVMNPTVTLSRKLFEAPTSCYKTGVAFLAWLNGFQPDFVMLEHFENRRSVDHLVEVFELAVAAGAIRDPDLAVERMLRFLVGAAVR